MKNPVLWVVEIFDGKIWMHTGWVEFTKKEGSGQLQQTRFMFPNNKYRLVKYVRAK